MTPAPTYIQYLRRLDRQERAHLTTTALTGQLNEQFRAALSQTVGREVPADALLLTGYPISQLYAAAVLATTGNNGPHRTGGGIQEGNQEELDMIVAWSEGPDDNETAVVIGVQAAGVGTWGGKRLLSQAHRLGDVFGYTRSRPAFPWIEPHFVLASPSMPPADLITLEWPEWMLGPENHPVWLRLAVPHDLLKITRTMPDGTPRGTGGFWKAERA